MKKVLIGFFLFSCMVLKVNHAQAGVGTTALQFLNLGGGARAVGMAEAQVTVAKGAETIFWNPARLSIVKNSELLMMHSFYWVDVNYEFVSYVLPLTEGSGLGIYAIYVNYGIFDKTTETADGTSYITSGTFGAYSFALGVGYGWELSKELTAGTVLKVANEVIDDDGILGFAVDAGMVYLLPFEKIRLGVTVQNVGTDIGDGSLPMLIKVGLGKEFDLIKEDDFTVASDMVYTLKEKITVNFGAEFWYEDFIAARAGYILGQDTGNISFGVGFKKF